MTADQAPEIKILTDETFDAAVAGSTHLVVDFWAEWCQPCRALDVTIEQLSAKHAVPFEFAKVDIAQSPDLPARFGISSVPTMVVFRDQEPVKKVFGAKSERQLEAILLGLLE